MTNRTDTVVSILKNHSDLYKKVWLEGYLAFIQCVPRANCPRQSKSFQNAWYAGYDHARKSDESDVLIPIITRHDLGIA